jgi:hypothetical protein
MNKGFVIASLTAATVIAAVVAFAAPSTEVKASTPAGAESDSLPALKFGPACSQKAWPYYDNECVRDYRQATGQATKVRFVSVDRL